MYAQFNNLQTVMKNKTIGMIIVVTSVSVIVPSPLVAKDEKSLLQQLFSGEIDQWWERKLDDIKSTIPEWLDKGTENLPSNVPSEVKKGGERGARAGVFVSNESKRLIDDFTHDVNNFSRASNVNSSSWDYEKFKDNARREVNRNVLDAVPVLGDVVVRIQEQGRRIYEFTDRVKKGVNEINEFFNEIGDGREALDVRPIEQKGLERNTNVLNSSPLPDSLYGEAIHDAAKFSGIETYAYKDPREDPYLPERVGVYQNGNPEDGSWAEMSALLGKSGGDVQSIPRWKPEPMEVTAWHFGMEIPEICWEGLQGRRCETTPRLSAETASALSGTWVGMNCPSAPGWWGFGGHPLSFTLQLNVQGSLLSGTITENDELLKGQSSIQGHLEGNIASFQTGWRSKHKTTLSADGKQLTDQWCNKDGGCSVCTYRR